MTFAADHSTLWTNIATVAILLIILSWALYRIRAQGLSKLPRAYAQLFLMLTGFGMVICVGIAAFSGFSIYKLSPVVIEDGKMDTPYGAFSLQSVNRAAIEPAESGGLLSKHYGYMLVIETADNKAIVLSEAQYPIRDILQVMQRETVIQEEGKAVPRD